MALVDFAEQPHGNPLEVVEQVASSNGWSFEARGPRTRSRFSPLENGPTIRCPIPGCFDIEAPASRLPPSS